MVEEERRGKKGCEIQFARGEKWVDGARGAVSGNQQNTAPDQLSC